jgi:hypothetical protein
LRTDLTPEQIIANAVMLGKVLVRILEACDILLEKNPVWTEQLLLRQVRALYTHRLRRLVAIWPPELTAEILAASEKMSGVVTGFSRN